jgi:Protein of unknown function (DUF2892)
VERNMGSIDRIVRTILGVVAIALALLAGATTVLGIVLWVFAAIMLVTAAVAVCPVYAALRINTLGGRPRRSVGAPTP